MGGEPGRRLEVSMRHDWEARFASNLSQKRLASSDLDPMCVRAVCLAWRIFTFARRDSDQDAAANGSDT